MKQILFICTGNYYRSRFAEELFNVLAERSGLEWRASSRGLDTLNSKNIGPISPYVPKKLKELDIPINGHLRAAAQLEETDLRNADLIIAIHEVEHKPMVGLRFPKWAELVVYWDVPDLHLLGAEDALSKIEHNVTRLVEQLSSNSALPDGDTNRISCRDRPFNA